MKLYASEDEAYQIRIGHEIVEAYPELYNSWIIQDIKQKLEACAQSRPDLTGGRSIDDIFAIATYDYWQYGIGPTEEFYNQLLGASHDKKCQYLTFRGRFNYIDYLNKKEDMHLLRNKWHAYQLLKDAYRREVLLLESEKDYPAFEAFCHRHSSFVLKPIGLGQSIGIRKVEVGNTELHKLFNQLFAETEAINSHYNSAIRGGLLVEEVIEQGEDMAVLHPASANSVRITTVFLGDGDVRMWYPVIRIGVGGNFISSGAAGSLVAGINMCTGITETPGVDELGRITEVHPDTHITIKGIKIPRWRQLCNKAFELAERLPTLRFIGWDFVYDKDKEWVVMEGNENAEILSQFVYHRGERGEFEQFVGYKPTKQYWWQDLYPSRFENIQFARK